ncbi:MAG: serine/threonine protein kinase [Planctomycetes bacterium]|nr:serine/threonine protein kinase [Planctomycetota bacterium]
MADLADTSPNPGDQLLVELAVKNHLISQSEAAESLKQARAAGQGVGVYLVTSGLLQPRHVESLQRKARSIFAEREASHEETLVESTRLAPREAGSEGSGLVLFGRLAVRRGWLTPVELQRGLEEQAAGARRGQQERIGEVLVRLGCLDSDQVREILFEQDVTILVCTRCEQRLNASRSGTPSTCPNCGGALTRSESLAAQGTHPGASQLAGLAPTRALPPPAQSDPLGLIGRRFAERYFVERLLGRGGMGAVYLVRQESLGVRRALKVMLRGSEQTYPGERERFMREAKLVATLKHPSVVRVIEAEWEGSLRWFTMEFVEGESLGERFSAGTIGCLDVARVVAEVARAMHSAHGLGVIHRDLKPHNIMIEPNGRARVLDFGLAKNLSAASAEELTQVGGFVGTPSYMAPEQAAGDPETVTHLCDVYALGAILYQGLAGRPPFVGSGVLQILRKVVREEPTPIESLTVTAPPPLCAVAMRALAKDPGQRFLDCEQLALAIESALREIQNPGRTAESAGGG